MLSAACICAASFGGHATAQGARPPEGTKIAAGRHFDLYVAKTDQKPMAADYTLNIYQVTAVARTLKHGTQRIRRRVETTNSNLLDPASWEVVDFDRDTWDDYRYVAGVTKGGCHTWEAERWEPDHDRFTSAPKYARWSDAQNKAVTGGCIGKK
jgi:hypothetical protein